MTGTYGGTYAGTNAEQQLQHFSPHSPTKNYISRHGNRPSPSEDNKLLECFDEDQGVELEENVCLQLWDTPGQETFRSLVKIYYRNVQAVVLVISLQESPLIESVTKQLAKLEYWLSELSNNSSQGSDTSFILLGNKADLLQKEGHLGGDDVNLMKDLANLIYSWCEEQETRYGFHIEYYNCSTKNGNGIMRAFPDACPCAWP